MNDAHVANDESTIYQLLGVFSSAKLSFEITKPGLTHDASRYFVPLANAAFALQAAASRMFNHENLGCIQGRIPDAAFSMLRWHMIYSVLGQDPEDLPLKPEMDTAIRLVPAFPA